MLQYYKIVEKHGLHKKQQRSRVGVSMQNRKKGKPMAKKHHGKVRFEDLLEDDRFDDEDYDNVTDDTLEFLSLDDDMIESYQKEQSAKKARGAKGKKIGRASCRERV